MGLASTVPGEQTGAIRIKMNGGGGGEYCPGRFLLEERTVCAGSAAAACGRRAARLKLQVLEDSGYIYKKRGKIIIRQYEKMAQIVKENVT